MIEMDENQFQLAKSKLEAVDHRAAPGAQRFSARTPGVATVTHGKHFFFSWKNSNSIIFSHDLPLLIVIVKVNNG